MSGEPAESSGPCPRARRVVMLLENNPYPQDVRVRSEAESLAGAGFEVEVLAPRARGQPRTERIQGVHVRRFRCTTGRGLGGLLGEYLIAAVSLHLGAMRALIQGTRVLHIHNPPDIFFPAGALFRLFGGAVVFDYHDLAPETVQVKFGARLPAAAARVAERLTFAVATHVIATNDSYAEIAQTRGRKSPERVTVVRNAPPDDWLALPLQIRPGRLSSLELAYLGAISAQDGIDSIAPILARLVAAGLNARLTVIGDGDGRPALERELRRYGVADHVRFTGWVDWREVPQRLAGADVCIDPAAATEVNTHSTMIKVAEYLALGKPVVAFDLLETRRTAEGAAVLVRDGDIEAFAEAIELLADDPTRRLELARSARRRAQELVWRHSEERLLAAYSSLAIWASRRGIARPLGSASC